MRIQLRDVATAVHRALGVPFRELRSKYRERDLMIARAAYYRVARSETEASFFRLASFINKDHSSAMHGMKAKADRRNEAAIRRAVLLVQVELSKIIEEKSRKHEIAEIISGDHQEMEAA